MRACDVYRKNRNLDAVLYEVEKDETVVGLYVHVGTNNVGWRGVLGVDYYREMRRMMSNVERLCEDYVGCQFMLGMVLPRWRLQPRGVVESVEASQLRVEDNRKVNALISVLNVGMTRICDRRGWTTIGYDRVWKVFDNWRECRDLYWNTCFGVDGLHAIGPIGRNLMVEAVCEELKEKMK